MLVASKRQEASLLKKVAFAFGQIKGISFVQKTTCLLLFQVSDRMQFTFISSPWEKLLFIDVKFCTVFNLKTI